MILSDFRRGLPPHLESLLTLFSRGDGPLFSVCALSNSSIFQVLLNFHLLLTSHSIQLEATLLTYSQEAQAPWCCNTLWASAKAVCGGQNLPSLPRPALPWAGGSQTHSVTLSHTCLPDGLRDALFLSALHCLLVHTHILSHLDIWEAHSPCLPSCL